MRRILLSFLFYMLMLNVAGAQLKSPDEFLGYELGTKFTAHDDVVAYCKYLGKNNGIRIQTYGKTYEQRELLVAVVSSKENMDNLEAIRKNNLGLSKGQSSVLKNQPAIVWLSYNVHGNEASCTETALKMLFTLVERKTKNVQDWLKNTVVIIDPCLNPDGRERYVNFFNEVSGHKPNPNPMAREHQEPWPSGRYNHYYFDLNRDWAWQTQVETKQRLSLYQQWMPEVHVDFHEQNYNEPYYFAPAAEPIHEDITKWQREFQVIVGRSNAKYFDAQGWQYFTKERFDLLYPSYGDTYPLYNGAIGMTYEQGGIGAGLAVATIDGDTLTLKDRIDHHYGSGITTLETISQHAGKLVDEFRLYFQRSIADPPGAYKTYVVKAENMSRLGKLAQLLKDNGIEYAFGGDKSLRGFNYENKKMEGFKLERNDLVVNLQQPKAVLASVLFEPSTTVNDSNTYDITAWALPYAYGLKAYGVKESVSGSYNASVKEEFKPLIVDKPYAWIFPWNALSDVQVLIALQKAGIRVRTAEEGFKSDGMMFSPGSLLVYRNENEKAVKNLSAKIAGIQKNLQCAVYTASSGYVESGKDFGSAVYPVLTTPKVAVVAGAGISSQSVGEIWHFFEQELHYPVTMIGEQSISTLDINKINVLILPDGTYADNINEKLASWVNIGGKIILFEDAISSVVEKKPFSVKVRDSLKNELKVNNFRRYGDRRQEDLSTTIPGAIFKVDLDVSHPLAAGLGKYYYALKTDDKIYEPLPKEWNIGVLKSNSYMAGIAGKSVLKKLDNGMLFGVQSVGKGTAVYLGSNILFRSFWENGKQMFANVVFLIN
ncbi:M14 metallopeptidase family protein [Pedobacter frigoris]|uniref:M14 metallopeptidase family protein n=1 Tax=Pedobacter frigoris TaxID=2571272 RepID=UPI001CECDA49|nr:M14 metallopeptidase family protein [Pedobacter frigoris]